MSIWKAHCRGLFVIVFLAAACATAKAQSVTADDKAAIQQLSASYMTALFGCKAEEFADLFVPDTGSFYDDEVYEKTGPGQWRVKSSTHVAPAAH